MSQRESLNLLVFMTDQWRWDTLYERDHVCRTPNLDQFMTRAQVFDNAFTCCPLCTPARGSLMTGLWPHQTGLVDNIGGTSYYPFGKLHRRHRTFLERLQQDAGYQIAYSGKWHLGEGTLNERGVHNTRASDGGDRADRSNLQPSPPDLHAEAFSPFYATYDKGIHVDEHRVGHGLAQLRDLATSETPFCLTISTYGPHFPHTVPRSYAAMYDNLPENFMPDNYSPPFSEDGKPIAQSRPYWPCQHTELLHAEDWRRTCQHYWGFCTMLDTLFGRVTRELDRLNLTDRTIIAFFADHGEMLGAHGMFDKGPYFYEEIVRIPMMIFDPLGRQPLHPHSFMNLRDLFPTAVALMGAGNILTEDERTRSYWQSDRTETFFTYDAYQGRQFKIRGVRAERFKYNWSPNDLCELYDLEADPGERQNMSGKSQYAEIENDLRKRLFTWMKDEGDYLLSAKHLPLPGSYIDGRSIDEQHDHGVTFPQRTLH